MFSLKRQLKKTRKAIVPSAVFRAQLLSELSLAYDQEHGCPRPRSFLFRFATVGLTSLVLVFTMGAGVYAYESPEVTEGHPLHFMKSGVERIQEGVSRSPEARTRFHARMMERRLEEGEYLLSHRPQDVPPSLDAAADQFENSIQALGNGVDDAEMRNAFIEVLSVRRARYVELSSRVSTTEEESGKFDRLRMRIEGHGLSEEEFIHLFEMGRRANDSLNGR